MKYRKKPVEVEAEQYVTHQHYVKGMCDVRHCPDGARANPHVHTIHDNQAVSVEPLDWIIAEPDGIHFYPCKPEIFADTHEPVDIVVPVEGCITGNR